MDAWSVLVGRMIGMRPPAPDGRTGAAQAPDTGTAGQARPGGWHYLLLTGVHGANLPNKRELGVFTWSKGRPRTPGTGWRPGIREGRGHNGASHPGPGSPGHFHPSPSPSIPPKHQHPLS